MSWVRQELFLLTQEVALIVKMIRVILLVAVLLIVPYFFAQSKSVGSFIYLGLPFGFYALRHCTLLQLCLWSFLNFYLAFFGNGYECLRTSSGFKSFLESGTKAFLLAFILFLILILGGFLLVYHFV